MFYIIKNNKWVITTSIVCILFGVLTFFTFINRSFIELNDSNLQNLIIADSLLLIIFFVFIINKTYKIFKERKKGKLGSETSLRYIVFFFSYYFITFNFNSNIFTFLIKCWSPKIF